MATHNAQVEKMREARGQATFDSNNMGEIIHAGKEAVQAQRAAYARVECLLGLSDNMLLPPVYGDNNRQQLMLEALKVGEITFKDGLDHKSDVFRYMAYPGPLGNANPFGIMPLLFTPFVKLQATDEQIREWIPKAESGEIVGCYTQTELGHGTFVGGIETTATFDKNTDEFVIHSPTLSSTKYWPGALGFTATHSMTMARLIIDGKDHGVHGFIMQVRSLEDGKPLLGIELGDIGLKMSYNGTDNGYAIFNHVRIPRTNLLMRYATVSRDGIYKSDPLRSKLVYGGMLSGRSLIVRSATFQLAQALTIATRYSIVREQGPNPDGGEYSIIDYQHQKHRLLTLISRTYVNVFAYQTAVETYKALLMQQARGDHQNLPYVHMLFCGLKAWATQTAADGAEEARKMCGGHGYMNISGLPEIVASITAMCTFEGENVVMWGQVARYLMKGIDSTTLPEDMNYVFPYRHSSSRVCLAKAAEFTNHSVLLEIFQHRAARLAFEAHALVKATQEKGKSRAFAENFHSLPLLLAGRAHIECYILSASIARIHAVSSATDPEIITVLKNLISLFALTTIASPLAPFAGSFLSSKCISVAQIEDMRRQIDVLLEKLRPDVIALTDAWSFSDASLRSAIGCADGNVYERIMKWTRQLSINVDAAKNGGVFKKGWDDTLGPFLRGGVKRREKVLSKL